MKNQELKKAFEEKLINEETYKQKLFEIATTSNKKKPQRQYEGLKEEEFAKLLKEYKIPKQKIILYLAYGSGLRLQEILNLAKDDFDFKSKTLKIRQGKFSKDRITIIPKYFKETHLILFPLNYTKMAVQKMFLKKSFQAGINKIIATYQTNKGQRNLYKYHFHCLRHSFAVNLIKKGVPLNYIQKLLGHSNISSTSVYTNVDSMSAIELAIERGF